MHAIVTGADGFLGSRLCSYLERRGWRVTRLARNPEQKGLGGEYRRFSFPDAIDAAVFQEPADVLIHAAFDIRPIHDEKAYAINRQAAAFLLARARERRIRFVFISSMSAHEKAESRYGREKLHIEKTLDSTRDLAIRPGFIVGEGGIFAALARSLRQLPIVPLFYGGQQLIHSVWWEDLCAGIESAVLREITGLVAIGEPEALTVRDFYRMIVRSMGLSKPFLPLPGNPALWLLKGAEACGLRGPLSSDNLLGLKRLTRYDLSTDLRRLAIAPRAARESLALVNWDAIFAGKRKA